MITPMTVDANIVESLGIMGKGMLGIFVVMILIALVVYGLTHMGSKKQ